jgi:mRNA interferase MazF
VICRGGVYWADLGEASGSKPAKRRPVLVIQSEPFNASRLSTTVAAVITSNTRLAAMPGNVFAPAAATGLPRDSVVNVTALVTLDKTDLGTQAGHLLLPSWTTSPADSAGYFPGSKGRTLIGDPVGEVGHVLVPDLGRQRLR